MTYRPEEVPQGSEIPSEKMTKEALDLMKKGISGGIGEALKSFKDLSAEDRKALFGGAIALVGYLLLAADKKTTEESGEKKKSETASKTSESLASETKTGLEKVKKELHAEKDISEKFDSANATPALTPVIAPAPAPVPEVVSRPETVKQDDVFYVGDSYMDGVTTGRGLSADNMDAVTSRPFVATGENWEGNDVYTRAMKTIDNPKCKTLVINGGLNDFYGSKDPEKTYNRLVKAYEKVLDVAKSKGVKVVILDVAKIPKDHSNKAGVIDYTDRLNKWFREQVNVKVVDTTTTIAGAFTKDKTHTTGKAYKRIYEKAIEAMA